MTLYLIRFVGTPKGGTVSSLVTRLVDVIYKESAQIAAYETHESIRGGHAGVVVEEAVSASELAVHEIVMARDAGVLHVIDASIGYVPKSWFEKLRRGE